MKPNFLVIGAQKCATSSLCERLTWHPDVFVTTPKEPYFFADPDAWAKGWDWYESLYADAGSAKARGEGSTLYSQKFLYPEAADRIADALPEAKLIYIVRDPLERMRSHWMHLRSRAGREERPFNVAVREFEGYLDNSRYLKQVDVYRERFPDEQILVLFFEDYRADAESVTRRTLDFLGLDASAWAEREETAGGRHASAAGRVDTKMSKTLRTVPGYQVLRDLAPGGLRDTMRRMLKKPVGPRPLWDDETREWALDRIGDESVAFLERYGKTTDLWPSVSGRPLTPIEPDDADL